MLLHLLYPLSTDVSLLNVVGYITFRTAAATLTALALSLLLGPWFIRRLRQFQIGQVVRSDGPASHKPKAGTPTMGGLLILAAVFSATLLWADLTNPHIWVAVLATAAFGAVGLADDYLKITRHSHHGLFARYKVLVPGRGRSCGRRVADLAGDAHTAALRHQAAVSVLQEPDAGPRLVVRAVRGVRARAACRIR